MMLKLINLKGVIHQRTFPALALWRHIHMCSILSQQQKNKQLAVDRKPAFSELSFGEKVKETTKTTTYTGVVVIGIGATLFIFYTIFKELFSTDSPNGVYNMASKKCLKDSRVCDALGEPIITHGEETSRGRRRHISHVKYMKNGIEHMRMKFYLKGSRKLAECHVEAAKNNSGHFEFLYIILLVNDLRGTRIVIENNLKTEPLEADYVEL